MKRHEFDTQPMSKTEQDAARWRWFREHAALALNEDGDLTLGMWVAGDGWRESQAYLTDRQRRILDGHRGPGFLDDANALDAAIDHCARENEGGP